jgi:2-isopropylmalate synthase
LGVAVANSLAALKNGALQVETTINGLGERAGNCALEELVMAISTRGPILGFGHNINTERIYRASQRVSSLTGIPVPVCKAIVGANAFSHQSGIHQHGMLANRMTYEIMTPQSVGKAESSIVLGKLSGTHACSEKLKALGVTLDTDDTDKAFVRFKELVDRKKNVADDDIEALVNSLMNIPEHYALESVQITNGRGILGMASVTLAHDGTAKSEAAVGDGPIDAAYTAILRIVGGEWSLEAYEIKAVTGGRDALGEVTVRVQNENGVHVGRGLSTDIIEASILAYINAINRAIAKKARELAL